MVDEANAIADLFPDSDRVVIRGYFKSYVEDRIMQYDAGNDAEKNKQAASQSELHSDSLWKIAAAATKSEDATVRNRGSMMAASLNDMIDEVTKRRTSRETTVP